MRRTWVSKKVSIFRKKHGQKFMFDVSHLPHAGSLSEEFLCVCVFARRSYLPKNNTLVMMVAAKLKKKVMCKVKKPLMPVTLMPNRALFLAMSDPYMSVFCVVRGGGSGAS